MVSDLARQAAQLNHTQMNRIKDLIKDSIEHHEVVMQDGLKEYEIIEQSVRQHAADLIEQINRNRELLVAQLQSLQSSTTSELCASREKAVAMSVTAELLDKLAGGVLDGKDIREVVGSLSTLSVMLSDQWSPNNPVPAAPDIILTQDLTVGTFVFEQNRVPLELLKHPLHDMADIEDSQCSSAPYDNIMRDPEVVVEEISPHIDILHPPRQVNSKQDDDSMHCSAKYEKTGEKSESSDPKGAKAMPVGSQFYKKTNDNWRLCTDSTSEKMPSLLQDTDDEQDIFLDAPIRQRHQRQQVTTSDDMSGMFIAAQGQRQHQQSSLGISNSGLNSRLDNYQVTPNLAEQNDAKSTENTVSFPRKNAASLQTSIGNKQINPQIPDKPLFPDTDSEEDIFLAARTNQRRQKQLVIVSDDEGDILGTAQRPLRHPQSLRGNSNSGLEFPIQNYPTHLGLTAQPENTESKPLTISADIEYGIDIGTLRSATASLPQEEAAGALSSEQYSQHSLLYHNTSSSRWAQHRCQHGFQNSYYCGKLAVQMTSGWGAVWLPGNRVAFTDTCGIVTLHPWDGLHHTMNTCACRGTSLRSPRGIGYCSYNNALMVACQDQHDLTVLDAGDLSLKNRVPLEQIHSPRGVALLPEGNLVVSEVSSRRCGLSLHDPQGRCQLMWGRWSQQLDDRHTFDYPNFIAVDHQKRILVCDRSQDDHGPLRIFSRTGELIRSKNRLKFRHDMKLNGIAVDNRNNIVVASEGSTGSYISLLSPDLRVIATEEAWPGLVSSEAGPGLIRGLAVATHGLWCVGTKMAIHRPHISTHTATVPSRGPSRGKPAMCVCS